MVDTVEDMNTVSVSGSEHHVLLLQFSVCDSSCFLITFIIYIYSFIIYFWVLLDVTVGASLDFSVLRTLKFLICRWHYHVRNCGCYCLCTTFLTKRAMTVGVLFCRWWQIEESWLICSWHWRATLSTRFYQRNIPLCRYCHQRGIYWHLWCQVCCWLYGSEYTVICGSLPVAMLLCCIVGGTLLLNWHLCLSLIDSCLNFTVVVSEKAIKRVYMLCNGISC